MSLTYDDLCRFVGKLYLDAESLRDQSSKAIADLTSQLRKAEQERDQAVAAIAKKKE